MPLQRPNAGKVSQAFGNRDFAPEPVGYFANAADGRPLKAHTSRFPGSYYEHDLHKGLDVYAAQGTPIVAMEAGTVTTVDRTNGVIKVRIQGHSNVWFGAGHCDTIKVSVGTKVKRGQTIATMGKRGNATGSHNHVTVEISEKHKDGVTRRMYYDAARFMPPQTYVWGSMYGSGYLKGGDLQYDERIYPIHSGVIAAGVNIRSNPDTQSDILMTTTGPTTVVKVNERPGGTYTVAGVSGKMWAKVKLPDGRTGYVAVPLITP